jgi:hypothetical protein
MRFLQFPNKWFHPFCYFEESDDVSRGDRQTRATAIAPSVLQFFTNNTKDGDKVVRDSIVAKNSLIRILSII